MVDRKSITFRALPLHVKAQSHLSNWTPYIGMKIVIHGLRQLNLSPPGFLSAHKIGFITSFA
jgi:hypothetical protein